MSNYKDFENIQTEEDYIGTSGCAFTSASKQSSRLPIFKYRRNILYLLEKYRCLVVVGETGSGKSTQIPQYLYNSGWCDDGRMIGITQPRRVAVMTLAGRVAEEMNKNLGDLVGYKVRFEGACTDSTRIKFMTDGVMLRELISDPLLVKYSIIIIDEAHERSTTTDVLLGLLRKVMAVRNDLRIIVSSATLDAELFKNFFEENETDDKNKDTATILSVEGRNYPVNLYYSKEPVPDYVIASVRTCINIHKNYGNGDILVFLTGMDEVNDAIELLDDEAKRARISKELWILGLYGSMPINSQMLAFETPPYGKRKIVFTTNIAEASITIPGVSFVVDCGFVRTRMVVNVKSGLEQLVTLPVSKASAEQRAGRAGRIGVGKCFRLYTKSDFDKFELDSLPEIQRIDFSPVILMLKNLGVNNIVRFKYISRPKADSVAVAFSQLHSLGAVDDSGNLTDPLGIRMARLPLSPIESKVLIQSGSFECSEEITSILAMIQIEEPFTFFKNKGQRAELIRKKFCAQEGDHLTLLNIYMAFIKSGKSRDWCNSNCLNYRALMKATTIKNQLISYLKSFDIPVVSCQGLIGETERILRCLVSGYFLQAAFLDHSGSFITVRENVSMNVWAGSSIVYREKQPKWIIFGRCMAQSIRDISEISMDWLMETGVFEKER
ncbi:Probable ATP-dependent RNA helicase DHX35 [Strongyloides ratti]|uniref:RNA helicase n=1 Tax=Strongyloides ratti TaxID=34506 RepID=A0A090MY07_STRRB|nr:Probable ATP-dependent RNA helicase DHX35 [Strongyloides ratti]CEF66354.1 Probable ATP-dependent RNA helicase DHX35 [Strongyloides ratti]